MSIEIRSIKVLFSNEPKVDSLSLILTSDSGEITRTNFLAKYDLPKPVESNGVWYSELPLALIEMNWANIFPNGTYARVLPETVQGTAELTIDEL